MTREHPEPAPALPARAADDALPAAIGPYRILRRLGAGAMGVVYEARHAERGERVALKTLHDLDPGALFRLKNEFRRLADLRHPNLASLYELASDGGRWFLTMEFIDGVDFVTYVRQDPATSAERARRALAQLADVLRSLHAAGTLHRDVKSSNVMVTRDGRLVLVDFGLAGDGPSSDQETTDSDVFLGTPAYMSPEQAAGLPPTAASEWY
ncbi:MAG TPA: serine/threonine-protein kinase, partial [Nannocystaceae bacterium]|nr:serine/threonine-protein kinase [Nannocystaceae bacterium]